MEGFLFWKTRTVYIYKRMTKIILLLAFVVANIVLAQVDACKIKQQKKICHAINAFVYFALLFFAYTETHSLQIVLGLTLLRVPVFNTSLNYFRGLKLTYISQTTGSNIDRLTNPIIEKIGYWTYHTIVLLASLTLIFL